MFELVQVAPNTYYIESPAKMGVYRLDAKRVILIDTGNDKEAGRRILNRVLAPEGWELTAVINTHSNADHIGGNRLLHERTGCPIYTTPLEGAINAHPIMEPTLLFGGYPPKPLRNKFLMAEASPALDLADLDKPAGMEFIPLPGHYLDMMGVRTPDDVVFLADCLSGEAILEKYHINFIYDVRGYLETLDRVEAMEAKLFIPAHAAPAEDIRPLVQKNRAKVYEILGKLTVLCERPRMFEDVLKAMFDDYGLSMDFSQYVLVGSTLRSYLAYMLDEGLMQAEFTDNRLLWHSV